MSCADSSIATAPRFGSSSTSPSAASILIASRSGVRDTFSSSHSARSFSLLPGGMWFSTISWRSRVHTCWCSTWRGMEMMSAMASFLNLYSFSEQVDGHHTDAIAGGNH